MDKRLLSRIDQKKKRLDEHRPLPKLILKTLQEAIAVEWTYNSNAIEGNSLTLQETFLVLQEGITIKGKSLREHFEAKNHENAITYLEEVVKKQKEVSEQIILDTHSLVLENIEKEYAGRYRPGQVRIVGANFVPPNARKISQHMEEFIENIRTNPHNHHHVVHAARIHHKFVWIHPFVDGNGRTGRLLMNLLLMQHGYPPAVVLHNDRKRYYASLNQANNERYEELELLIGQAVERSLDMYLDAIESASEETEYKPLRELASIFGISQEYLRLLARTGKIDAYKQGRNWVSTKKAIEEYKASA